MLSLYELTCEYSKNPIGLDVPKPRLSWKSSSPRRGAGQSAYQILVAKDLNLKNKIWDSGRVESNASIHVAYSGEALTPGLRCFWSVRVWNETGEASEWSETAFWEMGLLSPSNWSAEWITPDWDEDPEKPAPPPMLRRVFSCEGAITSARLYATSLGVYELRLNGRRVGDAVLAPGWTSYDHRIQYQTYDVTDLIESGENALGAILGDGWYRGYLGFQKKRCLYGEKSALIAQLHIVYADGSTDTIATDTTWRASIGAIQMADLYMGETYDARLEKPGWDKSGYADGGWSNVLRLDHPKDIIVAQDGPLVERHERITPIAIVQSPKGETIYDFGQNMVGWVQIKVRAEKGTVITLHHAEVLDQDGNLYLANLRTAEQTVTYTCGGGPSEAEVFEPHFTFMGFRYVSVDGLPGEPTVETLTGIVLHSSMEKTGTFECSSPIINQLQHNILWGQKGNYLDVPTDCPQRDERLGWTGDAQVFIRTACFNMNVAGFFTKWLRDLRADQRPTGSVPFVAPDVLTRAAEAIFGTAGGAGSSAWGDAAVICPWTIYLCYGDRRLLEEHYVGMTGWVDFIESQADENNIWNSGFHFGDWLDYRGPAALMPAPVTNKELIATAFYAYSAEVTARVAATIGKSEDAAKYSELAAKVKKSFCEEFVTPEGRVGPNTQTAYALALHFDLLREEIRPAAAARLAEVVRGADYHLTTGFVGTPYLCGVLSRYGYLDLAYELLNQENYPSWLYPVRKGATTIWERWDGIKPDGSFQDVEMNSFNHYAYGAIGEWLYSVTAGIDIDSAEPGYRHILFEPRPGGGITRAQASIDSPYGLVASSWRLTESDFQLSVTVPPNARGTVSIPAQTADAVTENGKVISVGDGIGSIRVKNGTAVIEIGSGTYEFTTTGLTLDLAMATVRHVAGQLDRSSTLRDLISSEAAKAILTEHLGESVFQAPSFSRALDMPLFKVAELVPGLLTDEKLDAIDAALRRL